LMKGKEQILLQSTKIVCQLPRFKQI